MEEADAAPSENQALDDADLEQVAGGTTTAAANYQHDGVLNRALGRRRR